MSGHRGVGEVVVGAGVEARLRGVLGRILGSGSSYAPVLRAAGIELAAGDLVGEFLERCPFTEKAELERDRELHPPFGSYLTEPLERYTRLHQTSGTSTGRPMAVLDTPESWSAMLGCWREVYRAAGVIPGRDRICFAFSFGPFLGFWTAFEAAARDTLSLPGGGLSSEARLALMSRYGATVLCCTPTYAIRLGEILAGRRAAGWDEPVRVGKIIVAGEPGGGLAATRARISELWAGARVFDHHGMTEVGPVSFEHPERAGWLVVMGESFLAEVIDGEGKEVREGEEGELVLTTLVRAASPLLRYRTGDLVRKRVEAGRLCLEGGILGRLDDMLVVRGVNLYPGAVEDVVRAEAAVVEHRVERREVDGMDELVVKVELASGGESGGIVARLEGALRERFSMRIPVEVVGEGELPRFEFKARRWGL